MISFFATNCDDSTSLQMKLSNRCLAVLAIAALKCCSAQFLASKPPCETIHPFDYDSGVVHEASTVVAFEEAPWIQLDLTFTELAADAKLVLTSSAGTKQELDAATLALGNGYSAMLDGDTMSLELVNGTAWRR
jgi:hypothetical protein